MTSVGNPERGGEYRVGEPRLAGRARRRSRYIADFSAQRGDRSGHRDIQGSPRRTVCRWRSADDHEPGIRINTLAVGAKLPTMFVQRQYIEAGGLRSDGPNVPDLFRRAAEYVDKILRGAKPGNIPIEHQTKFDLVVNLTTAKALELKIPEAFLLRADEVIE